MKKLPTDDPLSVVDHIELPHGALAVGKTPAMKSLSGQFYINIGRLFSYGKDCDKDTVYDLGEDKFNRQIWVGWFGYALFRRSEWSVSNRECWFLHDWPVRRASIQDKNGKNMRLVSHNFTEDEVLNWLTTGKLPF